MKHREALSFLPRPLFGHHVSRETSQSAFFFAPLLSRHHVSRETSRSAFMPLPPRRTKPLGRKRPLYQLHVSRETSVSSCQTPPRPAKASLCVKYRCTTFDAAPGQRSARNINLFRLTPQKQAESVVSRETSTNGSVHRRKFQAIRAHAPEIAAKRTSQEELSVALFHVKPSFLRKRRNITKLCCIFYAIVV